MSGSTWTQTLQDELAEQLHRALDLLGAVTASGPSLIILSEVLAALEQAVATQAQLMERR